MQERVFSPGGKGTTWQASGAYWPVTSSLPLPMNHLRHISFLLPYFFSSYLVYSFLKSAADNWARGTKLHRFLLGSYLFDNILGISV